MKDRLLPSIYSALQSPPIKKKVSDMEETKNIRKELRRLEDVVDNIQTKLHNTAGLLELIRLGMERLYKEEDTYEISSVIVLKEYLLTINNTEIAKIQTMLTEMKERF